MIDAKSLHAVLLTTVTVTKTITIAIIALVLPQSSLQAAQISVSTKQVTLSNFQPSRTVYGKLHWKGGISLSSTANGFGGLSGIVVSNDGKRFIAISDRGWWVKARLRLDADQNLIGAENFLIAPLKIARKSKQKSTHWRDSEALAPWTSKGMDGPLLVGFERRARLLRYKHQKRSFPNRPQRIRHPKAIASGPFNAELESVGRFYAGPKRKWLIALSEENLDKNGNIRGWTWRAKRTVAFSLKRFEDYAITDLAVAPDGKTFFTLERSFNLPNLPGFAIRRFKTTDLRRGKTIKGELLFSGRQPFFAVDNMEGLAVHKTEKAAIQITIISDDNFNRSLQRTLIYRFELIEPK